MLHKLKLSSQSIAYRQSDGTQKPALLIVHGNSCSGRSFERIMASALGQTHRIVAIDLPGHGDSDVPPDPQTTYSLPGYARILVEAAEALDMADAIFVGWSLGGHVVMEAIAHLPQASGIVIYGAPPFSTPPNIEASYLPVEQISDDPLVEPSEEAMRASAKLCFAPNTDDIPDFFIEDTRRTDGQARVLIVDSINKGDYADEVEIVKHMTQPLMVIQGAQEQLINGDYYASLTMPTLWRGAVQIIDGAGHTPHWEAPHQFAKLLSDFVGSI